jgi:xanthine dehydrogenase accessory factor
MQLFAEIQHTLERGQRLALVTVIRADGSSPRKIGAHMVVRDDGSIAGTIGGGTVEHRLIERALEVIRRLEPEIYRVHLSRDLGMCCGGAMEFFIEPMRQQPQLVIFGAGHVALELASLAKRLEFRVMVIDDREEFATRERFPDADALLLEDPIDALKQLPFGPNLYLVIVTHLHRLDEDLLRELAHRDWRYLGMIGSRAKVARFLDRLEARGVPRARLERVHMPIGLAIGAITPAEIAVSIAAELVRVRNAPLGSSHPSTQESLAMSWRPGGNKAVEEKDGGEG